MQEVSDAEVGKPHSDTDVSTTATKLKLTRPHRLIQQAMEKEPEPKRDVYGYYRAEPVRPKLDINVSKGQRRHALIVMDRLIKALEERGFKVEVSEGRSYGYGSDGNHAAGTYSLSEDGRDRASISIREDHDSVPHIATAAELKEKELHKYGRAIPKYDSVPNGKLILSPGGVVDLSSEGAVGQVIQKAVADITAKLAEEKRQREAREESRRREHQLEQNKAAEKARIEAFHKAAGEFNQYRQLMAYIAEVRRFGRVPANQRREGQTLEEWLTWAERQARRMHPLG